VPPDADDPRPLLLVDVDGVVCPYGNELADPIGAGLRQVTVGFRPVWLSLEVAGHLKRLGSVFQLVWCTSWEERFEEPLGDDCHWKWPAIESFVADRPFAWIDD
jgi:hypothetical protein